MPMSVHPESEQEKACRELRAGKGNFPPSLRAQLQQRCDDPASQQSGNPLLNHPDPAMRKKAADAMGAIGAIIGSDVVKPGVPQLEHQSANDTDPAAKAAARKALENIKR